MALFQYNEELGQVFVKPDLLYIKEFEKLNNHKDRDRLLSFVYHTCDYLSPYAKFNDSERKDKLIEDLLGGKQPSADILKAIDKYKELNTTESLLLLEAARKGVHKLRQYFDTIDLEEHEDVGKAAKDLMMNLKGVGSIIDSIKQWEETIKKEQSSDQTRRGVKMTKYNKE